MTHMPDEELEAIAERRRIALDLCAENEDADEAKNHLLDTDIPALLSHTKSQAQRIAELGNALETIRDSHTPSQPVAMGGMSERDWVMQHVGRLRTIAMKALNPPAPGA